MPKSISKIVFAVLILAVQSGAWAKLNQIPKGKPQKKDEKYKVCAGANWRGVLAIAAVKVGVDCHKAVASSVTVHEVTCLNFAAANNFKAQVEKDYKHGDAPGLDNAIGDAFSKTKPLFKGVCN